MAEMFRAAPDGAGLAVEESDEYVAFFSPQIDILLFNRVVGLGVRAPATPEMVDSLTAKYRAIGVSSFGFQLSPYARPEALTSWVESAGLPQRDGWIKMYRDAARLSLIPTDLRIDQIGVEHKDAFGETACEGFNLPKARADLLSGTDGRPGWRHYIAWEGGTPAAVAAMYIKDEKGWLGVAATLPQFRKRGAQGALMSRRLQDGIKAGCKWFVTETGRDTIERPNPSYHNMVRTGFKLAYDRPNFMPVNK
jgi:hypothetical protein